MGAAKARWLIPDSGSTGEPSRPRPGGGPRRYPPRPWRTAYSWSAGTGRTGRSWTRCSPRASSRTCAALAGRGRAACRGRAAVAFVGGLADLPDGRDPAGHGVFDILEHQPGASAGCPSRRGRSSRRPGRAAVGGGQAGSSSRTCRSRIRRGRSNGVAIAGGVIPRRAPSTQPPRRDRAAAWAGPSTAARGRPSAGGHSSSSRMSSGSARRAPRPMRRLMDSEPWDARALVFVSPDRIQHCLLEYVHPGHPDHARAAATPVGRARARRLPDARPRAGHAGRADRRGGHGLASCPTTATSRARGRST